MVNNGYNFANNLHKIGKNRPLPLWWAIFIDLLVKLHPRVFPLFLHFQGSLHFSPKSVILWWNHMFSICFSGVNPMKSLLVKWNPTLISSHDPMYSKPNSSEISEIFWGVTFEGFRIKGCTWFCWGDHGMDPEKNPTEKSTYSWLVQW